MGALSGQEYEIISRIARALESIAISAQKMACPPLVVLRQEDTDKLKREVLGKKNV